MKTKIALLTGLAGLLAATAALAGADSWRRPEQPAPARPAAYCATAQPAAACCHAQPVAKSPGCCATMSCGKAHGAKPQPARGCCGGTPSH